MNIKPLIIILLATPVVGIVLWVIAKLDDWLWKNWYGVHKEKGKEKKD